MPVKRSSADLRLGARTLRGPGRRSYTPGMRTWILAAAACAALASCSGTPSSGNPQPGQQAATAAATAGQATFVPVAGTYCAKAPSSEVGSALGVPAGQLKAMVEGPVTVCAYVGSAEVIVRYEVGESATAFATQKTSMLHQRITAVSGLGDGAFFARYSAGKTSSNTLAARQGSMAVFITSPAALGAERTLMTKLLARL
jgi:hypothetical protein